MYDGFHTSLTVVTPGTFSTAQPVPVLIATTPQGQVLASPLDFIVCVCAMVVLVAHDVVTAHARAVSWLESEFSPVSLWGHRRATARADAAPTAPLDMSAE